MISFPDVLFVLHLFHPLFHSASNNLSGEIPYEIGAMEELQRIDLHSNKISGSLPNELGDLEDLRKYYCMLTFKTVSTMY